MPTVNLDTDFPLLIFFHNKTQSKTIPDLVTVDYDFSYMGQADIGDSFYLQGMEGLWTLVKIQKINTSKSRIRLTFRGF